MALNGIEFVGYHRAEYAKASLLRNKLVFVRTIVAAIAMVAIFSTHLQLLYVLGGASMILLVVWWFLNDRYENARRASQAARRAALLVNGLDASFSASEKDQLLNKFTVTAQVAEANQNNSYFASTAPPSMARLANIIEESAYYSEALQAEDAKRILRFLLAFGLLLIFSIFVLLLIEPVNIRLTITQTVFALIVFVLSSEVLGSYLRFRGAAALIRDVKLALQGLSDEEANAAPSDVHLIMADYVAAMQEAPETLPGTYERKREELEQGWAKYYADRKLERNKRPT